MTYERSWLIWAVMALALASAQGQEVPTFSVSGDVLGASGDHTIHVAVWDATGFLKKPVQEIRFRPGESVHYKFVLKPGHWAITAYEDLNENGVLDVGLFGPKEPHAFWRPFRGQHKPHFDEVAAIVDHDISDANLILK